LSQLSPSQILCCLYVLPLYRIWQQP
jgi:hypothetical protein